MLSANLLSFILNYFLNAKLACVVIFHCWNKDSLHRLSVISTQHSLYYIQYVNLNDSIALINFGHRYMRYDRPQIGVFVDFECNQTDYLIDMSSHHRLFNYRYNWLIFDQLSNFSRFQDTFKNINLSVDTQLTYAAPKRPQISLKSNKSLFMTFDVYNNGWFIGGALNVTANYEIECNKTECEKTKYLTKLYQRPLYGNRASLRDVTMRASIVVTHYDLKAPEEEINKYLLTEKDFHIDTLSRFGMQIFMLLKESLYTKVSYTYYSHWTDTGIKGGIVGSLIDETVDFSSSPFFHTTDRFHYLTPIAQTESSRSVCMFRTPRNSGIQGYVFLDPFSTTVWIIFGIVLALSALLLWAILLVEFHQMKICLEFVPSLLTTLLISFGSACVQGSFLIPRSLAGRLAFISLSLISFIMYNYYTSVVVSSLLGSPVKSKLKTLGDLADSDLDVGLEPLPYTFSYLNLSTLPVVRRFVKRKIERKRNLQTIWYSTQDGISKMRFKPGFVFIFEAQSGYHIIEKQYEPHEICDLNEIPFRSDSLLSLHLHKNSSYKEIIRLKLMRIMETGVHSRHRRLWERTRLNCLANNVLLSVGLEYTAPLFLMLLFCYLLVLVVFSIEIICYRYAFNRKSI